MQKKGKMEQNDEQGVESSKSRIPETRLHLKADSEISRGQNVTEQSGRTRENKRRDSTRQSIKEKDHLAIKEVKTRRGLSCKFSRVAGDIKGTLKHFRGGSTAFQSIPVELNAAFPWGSLRDSARVDSRPSPDSAESSHGRE